jgi:hypothetical protein
MINEPRSRGKESITLTGDQAQNKNGFFYEVICQADQKVGTKSLHFDPTKTRFF